MKIFEKKVKYFKFFEDSKIVEIDNNNIRIAIIFFGKENIIHIFDADPYINYIPVEENQDIKNPLETEDSTGKFRDDDEVQQDNKQDPKELYNQLNINNLNTNEEIGKTIITQNQEFIKFNNMTFNIGTDADESKKSESNIDLNLISDNNTNKQREYTNINLNIKSEYTNKNLKFSLYKPKIKNRILSVITCPSNIIIGIKWLNINQPQSNGQEKISNKQLLSVFEDGNVHVYTLKSTNYEIETRVNLNKLQSMPFETFPEQWKISGQVYTGKPIRDFYHTEKSNRLYTLHTDNYIIMWIITFIGNKLSLIASYAINITPTLTVNKILVDINDQLIYSFHNDCFKIFRIKDKPPFPQLYSKKFEEIVINDELVMNQQDANYTQSINKKKSCRSITRVSHEITPIKRVNDDFIDEDESYEIFYKDIIDLSEGMKIYDINFFFNVQKPEFSLLEEFLLIPIYLVRIKKYVLLKFHVKEYLQKITDFAYFERSLNGKHDDEILKILKSSHSPIVFSFSPFFYFLETNLDEESIFNCKNTLDILEQVYQPIVLINEGIINFMNLKKNSSICESEFFNKKIINPEFLVVNWCFNNTILMSSTKALMNVIKFCNELKVLGVPINPKKILELLQS